MSSPLNPHLYNQLQAAFGSVKIANEGVSAIIKGYLDDDDRPRLNVKEVGEQFRVCCPYCSDHRHRLYISHMFGKKDRFGRPMTFLALCWNENCFSDYDNQQDFIETLKTDIDELAGYKVKKGSVSSGELRTVQLPGPCTRLHKLRKNHEARLYVRSRGFNPDVLGKFYGVGYCENSMYYLARERLVIPIYKNSELVGWQCRHVGELPWHKKDGKDLPPKYFTCPGYKKSLHLLNLDIAKHYHTGILVEGWFDVFGFGPMCMPLLGHSMAPLQRKEFAERFADGAGVLLIDPDVQNSKEDMEGVNKTIKEMKNRMPGRFAVVWLPEGEDPGSIDRNFMRDYVAEHAADQGVKVLYKKVR